MNKEKLFIKIEEFPNPDILTYHISDKMTDIVLNFESEKDLQYGGFGSLNFENEEVSEELQFLVGVLLRDVQGLQEIRFSKYEIGFKKSPVFDWEDMEKEIPPIINSMIAKKKRGSDKRKSKNEHYRKRYRHLYKTFLNARAQTKNS